jgi:hypothetical protein
MPFQHGRTKTGGRAVGTPNKKPAELQALAREYTAEAVERVAELMRSAADEHVRLKAAGMLFDRGWGRAEITADLNVSHAFVVAPEVMTEADWVAAYATGVVTELPPAVCFDLKAERVEEKPPADKKLN